MPLIRRRKKDDKPSPPSTPNGNGNIQSPVQSKSHKLLSPAMIGSPIDGSPKTLAKNSQLMFYCQQAHGSHTGLIGGFTNVRDLYEKIAECYDFSPDEVMLTSLIVIVD